LNEQQEWNWMFLLKLYYQVELLISLMLQITEVIMFYLFFYYLLSGYSTYFYVFLDGELHATLPSNGDWHDISINLTLGFFLFICVFV
jgi:hypothetical protein